MHLTSNLIKRKSLLSEAANDAPYAWQMAFYGRAPLEDAARMNAAEQMFFLGAPLAHVVEYEERMMARRVQYHRASMSRLC